AVEKFIEPLRNKIKQEIQQFFISAKESYLDQDVIDSILYERNESDGLLKRLLNFLVNKINELEQIPNANVILISALRDLLFEIPSIIKDSKHYADNTDVDQIEPDISLIFKSISDIANDKYRPEDKQRMISDQL